MVTRGEAPAAPANLRPAHVWARAADLNRDRVPHADWYKVYRSVAGDAAGFRVAGYIRNHWGIENGLHWALDVSFREDDSRTRAGHAAANLGMLRRAAVSLALLR